MFCQNCGADIGNSKFCKNCGAAVNRAKSSTQQRNAPNQQQVPTRQGNVTYFQQQIPPQRSASPTPVKAKKPIYKRWWFWLIAFFLLVGLLSPKSKKDATAATKEDAGNVKSISFYDTSDVTVRVGETTSDQYRQYVKYKANGGKEVTPEDVEFISENPEIATICLTEDSLSRFYYEITGIGAGETFVYVRSVDGSVATEKIKVIVPTPIQVERIEISIEKSEIAVGEALTPTVSIFPEDADDKAISWVSSDEAVATINEKGNITALSGGTTTITASSANGVSSSVEITVDGTKHLMQVKVTHPRDDDNNIGDEWSYKIEINGERPTSTMVLSPNDILNCWAKFSEDDSNPDVGEASKSYTIKEEDLMNGFTITMDLYVKENGGNNSGKSAHFIVTFDFSPVS